MRDQVAVASLVVLASLAWSMGARGAEPRPPEGPEVVHDRHGKARTPREEPARRDRRDIEGGGGSADVRSVKDLTSDPPLLQIDWRAGGCGIDDHPTFVKALLGLQNQSDLMSLEIWGDTHEYVPYQRVFYYLRVPRAAYVTMFWIGPKLDVFVPFQNLHIPADRDVKVDPDSIVVPPLGREQWVAVATLEPVPLECWATDAMHVAWVEKIKKLPRGVGRWEVRSK